MGADRCGKSFSWFDAMLVQVIRRLNEGKLEFQAAGERRGVRQIVNANCEALGNLRFAIYLPSPGYGTASDLRAFEF
jgi:hypothetical protein